MGLMIAWAASAIPSQFLCYCCSCTIHLSEEGTLNQFFQDVRSSALLLLTTLGCTQQYLVDLPPNFFLPRLNKPFHDIGHHQLVGGKTPFLAHVESVEPSHLDHVFVRLIPVHAQAHSVACHGNGEHKALFIIKYLASLIGGISTEPSRRLRDRGPQSLSARCLFR